MLARTEYLALRHTRTPYDENTQYGGLWNVELSGEGGCSLRPAVNETEVLSQPTKGEEVLFVGMISPSTKLCAGLMRLYSSGL